MAEDSELRQRKTQASKPSSSKTHGPSRSADDDDQYSPLVDVLRVITFLIVASCGLSYVVSGGASWFWGGVRLPEYATVAYWKQQFVREPSSLPSPDMLAR